MLVYFNKIAMYFVTKLELSKMPGFFKKLGELPIKFEDSLQIHSAYSISDMFCIFTRNIKDFQESEIAVYIP
jgi:hypothetical protein